MSPGSTAARYVVWSLRRGNKRSAFTADELKETFRSTAEAAGMNKRCVAPRAKSPGVHILSRRVCLVSPLAAKQSTLIANLRTRGRSKAPLSSQYRGPRLNSCDRVRRRRRRTRILLLSVTRRSGTRMSDMWESRSLNEAH
ncbi:hypothetical protein F2P81_001531 [Scophthalmus maximus]|uniref:Uncharacterized protein n=1 Tax=Scophthalmus maximus TaxID=52904 RepID=A0A6A4TSH2_SCOMX|nr:hypothetical protein F2P81_001531 [Scophthalmus maximus]